MTEEKERLDGHLGVFAPNELVLPPFLLLAAEKRRGLNVGLALVLISILLSLY